MKKYSIILIAFCIYYTQAQNINNAGRIGYESIKASDLRSHLGILASDTMEGRETAFPGQKKAADYIATFFKKLDLEAMGDSGTYFQHFDVELTRVDPKTKIISETNGSRKVFEWEKDFIADGTKDTTVSGPVAFVGFTDTELDSADRARLKGRIVFAFIGRKSFAGDTSKAATLRRLYAIRRDADAAAALMISDFEGPASYNNALGMIRRFGWDKGTMKIKGKLQQEQFPYLRFVVSTDMADEILRISGKSLKQIKQDALNKQTFSPIFIDNIIITIESKIERETRSTENVVGLLRGTDSILKNYVIAVTAHYDHVGKSKDGLVYPGADDNGSGTVAVLELAEAFTKNPVKPKRSMLFIAFAGEEKGLLGSDYYTNNPLVPLRLTTADLNIDMIGRIDMSHIIEKDTNYIYVIGSDKISAELDSILNDANRESVNLLLDYQYNNEYNPEQVYRGSDHFSFAKKDIPVTFFFDGIHSDYHKPTDSADRILFDRMEKVVRLIYNVGWKVANLDHPLINKSGGR